MWHRYRSHFETRVPSPHIGVWVRLMRDTLAPGEGLHGFA
jgi:hypothetical protein